MVDRTAENTNQRSVGEVLQNIVGNVEEIIRSEIRLAKTEAKEEALKAARAGAMLGAGALLGLYGLALVFVLFIALLIQVMPFWAASLIVAVITLIVAAILLAIGRAALGRVHKPEKSIESVKEDVAWLKHQMQ
jgi:uncharacterized membrane protein YqjE